MNNELSWTAFSTYFQKELGTFRLFSHFFLSLVLAILVITYIVFFDIYSLLMVGRNIDQLKFLYTVYFCYKIEGVSTLVTLSLLLSVIILGNFFPTNHKTTFNDLEENLRFLYIQWIFKKTHTSDESFFQWIWMLWIITWRFLSRSYYVECDPSRLLNLFAIDSMNFFGDFSMWQKIHY